MKARIILSAFTVIFLMISCAREDKYIGLQLYSLRDTINENVPGVIQAVGEMGYDFVEAYGFSEGKFFGMEPGDFKTLVEENGMDLLSSHTGWDLPDSNNVGKTWEWWDACIAAHKKAGVKYIVKPSMDERAYASLEGLQAYCDYFNEIGRRCNEEGIKFGYHNHAGEFKQLDKVTIYDYMLENTDPEKVFFQIDLYWAVEGGADPVAYFEQYPGRFELWHVKDEAEVGASGNINFEKIFSKAELAGMQYYIVEVEEYNYSPMESVEKSLEYLENLEIVKYLIGPKPFAIPLPYR